jgi:hypothetical protein
LQAEPAQITFMARSSFIICGLLACLGASSLQAQNARPVFPAQRPSPVRATPLQPAQPGAPAVVPSVDPVFKSPQPANPTEGSTGQAVPPVVTYRDGLLTVQAMNSNLSSVVTAIRNKTGIEFEGAENVSERVAISLGPLPESELLSAIFSGSKYDFVAIGRPDNPAIVQKVILTVKDKSGAVAESQPQARPAAGQEGDEDVPDEQVNLGGGDPQDTAVQPVEPPQQQPPQSETQPKSPEQLLQELQQMRQQKQPQDDQNSGQVPRKQPPI